VYHYPGNQYSVGARLHALGFTIAPCANTIETLSREYVIKEPLCVSQSDSTVDE
jgi:hypothetical protein